VWQAYRDKEERLVATAFYDLGMKLNRGSVEGRLANLSQVTQRESNEDTGHVDFVLYATGICYMLTHF
jgi:hypothetical protein